MIRIRLSRWILGPAVALSAFTLSPSLPRAAGQDLVDVGRETVWKPLYKMLESKDPERRRAALILSLNLVKTRETEEYFREALAKAALNTVEPDLRGMAIQAVATQSIDVAALSRIFRAAVDTKDPLLLESVALAVAGIHSRSGVPIYDNSKPKALEVPKDETIAEKAEREQADKDNLAAYEKNYGVRWRAFVPITVELLGGTDPKILLPLSDSLYKVTVNPVETLKSYPSYLEGLAELAAPLVALLRSPDPEIQRAAALTLRAFSEQLKGKTETDAPAQFANRPGSKAFKTALDAQAAAMGAALPSLEYLAKLEVLEALGEFRTTAASQTDPILAAMRNPSKFVRWAATRTIGKTLDPKATTPVDTRVLDALILAADDRERGVRNASLTVLNSLGTRASAANSVVAKLVGYGDVEGQVAAVSALAAFKTPTPEVVDVLGKALGSPDPRLRRASAQALGSMGKAALPTISALKVLGTSDDDADVREWAGRSLVRILAAE